MYKRIYVYHRFMYICKYVSMHSFILHICMYAFICVCSAQESYPSNTPQTPFLCHHLVLNENSDRSKKGPRGFKFEKRE